LAEIISGRWPHLAWTPDGSQLAVRDADSVQQPRSIFLLSVETGQKRKLTSPAQETFGDSRPAFSPDGKSLAFVRTTGVVREEVFVMAASGGAPKQLTFDGAQVFGLAWTADGREIVFSSTRSGNIVLWRVAVEVGTPQRLLTVDPTALYPSISRKGDRLAYTTAFEDSNIWRVQFSQRGKIISPPNLLISATRADFDPQYSPDGKRIAFISARTGKLEIWLCDENGANTLQLTNLEGATGNLAWSPDGTHIAFRVRADENSDIFEISVEDRKPRRLTSEVSEDTAPSWSKDGRWIYFASNRSGQSQIWKIPAGGGQPIQVTKNGGSDVKESPDGMYVYYTKRGDATGIWRLPVQGGEESLVVDLLEAGYLHYWTPTNEGIYFATKRTTPQHTIQFFNFATRRLTQIIQLDKPLLTGIPGLSLSPDEHSILYALLDQSGSDIMLMENFR
jgi:Tol biopolymer transport system component